MALIYSYKEKTSLTGDELLIGSDMTQYKNPSVSIKLLTVKDFTADAMLQGDSPYVPVFDATTDTLQNSIIQQNSNTPVDGISIGGAIDAVTNITASGTVAGVSVNGTNVTATSAVSGSTVQSTLNTTVGGDLIVSGAAAVTGDVTAASGVYSNNVTAGNSIDVGQTNNITGARAGAVGKNNSVAGDDSFSAGHDSHSLGDASVALGHASSAGGHGSLAAGFGASAGNEGTAKYTASIASTNVFTVDGLRGTATTGMYIYPFNTNERREITNAVDNGDGTHTITIAGSPVQTFDNVPVYFESASPDRDDQYGTIALGNAATSIGNNAVAIGYNAYANGAGNIAIGSSSAPVTIGGDLTIAGDLSITGAITSNTFAEITSGTWTPTLGTNPGGSIVYTYTQQSGSWYAVGDMVIAMFQIQGTAQGVSGSSIVTISMPHDPDFDEPGGTIYDAGNGFSVKPIGFGRSFSDAHSGASILGVNGEILTAAEVNFAQTFNVIGQLIYKK